jgi:peptidoglycan/LPS O-acetylase OafA/YrhL
LRTLGLITYPLYLTHNVIGSAIIRVLIDAGLDAYLAVGAGLSMLALVCWFISATIEPAIRRLLRDLFSNFELLPNTERHQIFQALSKSSINRAPFAARLRWSPSSQTLFGSRRSTGTQPGE